MFIYFLVFSSGFCIMGIEFLGGWILVFYFGSSVYIWGSIIIVFMLSLLIGYLFGGKFFICNFLLIKYGFIFFVVSIMVVLIVLFVELIMIFIFIYVEDSCYGLLLVLMVLFFIFIIILGMIFFYLVWLLVIDYEKSG